MSAMQGIIFAGITLLLALVSRRSLLRPGSHGFFRFFAFEGIAWLAVTHGPIWFRNPWAPWQILSWMLLIVSALLALHGFGLLRSAGHRAPAQDGAEFAFEQTRHLVTAGAYRYIRHPLYASLICLCWGICCKQVTWHAVLVAIATSVFLHLTARSEERENRNRFGPAYDSYVRATKMFIPHVW